MFTLSSIIKTWNGQRRQHVYPYLHKHNGIIIIAVITHNPRPTTTVFRKPTSGFYIIRRRQHTRSPGNRFKDVTSIYRGRVYVSTIMWACRRMTVTGKLAAAQKATGIHIGVHVIIIIIMYIVSDENRFSRKLVLSNRAGTEELPPGKFLSAKT